jgi:hypothetical protein
MVALFERSIFGPNLHASLAILRKVGNIEIRFTGNCEKTRVKSFTTL